MIVGMVDGVCICVREGGECVRKWAVKRFCLKPFNWHAETQRACRTLQNKLGRLLPFHWTSLAESSWIARRCLQALPQVAVNLPAGEYQISVPERVPGEKWGLPVVYVFTKWNDGFLAPFRQVLLSTNLNLCAHYKVSFRASFMPWVRIGSCVIQKYLALPKRLKLFKIKELGDTSRVSKLSCAAQAH